MSDIDMQYTSDFVRQRISQLRLERKISERELSFLINKSHSYIKDINRRRALPTFDAFLQICECLEVTPAEFFDPRIKQPKLAKSVVIELNRLMGDEDLTILYRVLKQLKSEQIKQLKRLFHVVIAEVAGS